MKIVVSQRNWGEVLILNITFIVLLIFSNHYMILIAVFAILEVLVLYHSLRKISISHESIIVNTIFGKRKILWSEVRNIPFYHGFGGKQFFFIETKNVRIKGFWSEEFKNKVIIICNEKQIKTSDPNSSWMKN
jgi:hypothetical protein